MIFYNIIYAHGIHTGGGLTLLKEVLAAVSKSPDYKFILDSRIRDEVSKYNLTYVDYFEPGILGRIRSELRLRKYGSEVTKVLSFNSLPFFLPLKYPITMFFQNVNLIYSTSVEQLESIRSEIKDYIIKSDDFVSDGDLEPVVRVIELGSSSIDIMIVCYSDPCGFAAFCNTKETLIFNIMKIVEKNDSEFAFPSTSLYLESTPEKS